MMALRLNLLIYFGVFFSDESSDIPHPCSYEINTYVYDSKHPIYEYWLLICLILLGFNFKPVAAPYPVVT